MPTKYKIGTGDPNIRHDPGAGIWNSKAKTIVMVNAKSKIIRHLYLAYPVVGGDAVKHMYHYFMMLGADYNINLQGMIDEVHRAKDLYEDELINIKQFVNALPVGIHNITTDSVVTSYNNKSQSSNWYYAVGGYSAWIKGTAKVEKNTSGVYKYRLDYEYKVVDRYNWDIGKKVELFGITVTDKFMGEFHRQGLAKEFKMHGSIKAVIEWDSTSPHTHTVVSTNTRR